MVKYNYKYVWIWWNIIINMYEYDEIWIWWYMNKFESFEKNWINRIEYG